MFWNISVTQLQIISVFAFTVAKSLPLCVDFTRFNSQRIMVSPHQQPWGSSVSLSPPGWQDMQREKLPGPLLLFKYQGVSSFCVIDNKARPQILASGWEPLSLQATLWTWYKGRELSRGTQGTFPGSQCPMLCLGFVQAHVGPLCIGSFNLY